MSSDSQSQQLYEALSRMTMAPDQLMGIVQGECMDLPSNPDTAQAWETAEQAVTNACSSPGMDFAQDVVDGIDNAFLAHEISLNIAEQAERFLLDLLEENHNEL